MFKELILIVNVPPFKAPSFTINVPPEMLKVPVCLPVGLLPIQVIVEVVSTAYAVPSTIAADCFSVVVTLSARMFLQAVKQTVVISRIKKVF